MVQQKDTAVSKQSRREMATLLSAQKIASARIRTESIIRADILVELYEILELYCELLLARVGMLENTELDEGLEEPIRSLIYSAPKIEIKEVAVVAALLGGRYGKEFVKSAQEGEGVADKVIRKLKVTPPSEALVQGYLEEIAATYGVDWPKKAAPPKSDDDNDGQDEGQLKERVPEEEQKMLLEADQKVSESELVKATPPRDFGPSSPLRVNPPHPSTDNPHPQVKGPPGIDLKPTKLTQRMDAVERKKSPEADNRGGVGGKIPEVDDLAARFAALKR